MINIYGNHLGIDKTVKNKLRILHYELLKKYQKYAELEFKNGSEELNRMFISKVYLDKSFTSPIL